MGPISSATSLRDGSEEAGSINASVSSAVESITQLTILAQQLDIDLTETASSGALDNSHTTTSSSRTDNHVQVEVSSPDLQLDLDLSLLDDASVPS